MKIHELKIWEGGFRAVALGLKRYEFRKDDGRFFEVGDVLKLVGIEEPSNDETKTGYPRFLLEPPLFVAVTYLTRGPNFGVPIGYVVMSIGAPIPEGGIR